MEDVKFVEIGQVPRSYFESCRCHGWACMTQHHVYFHKPLCAKFKIEYELAYLAHKYQKALLDLAREAAGGAVVMDSEAN
jgi:hypothetical protein